MSQKTKESKMSHVYFKQIIICNHFLDVSKRCCEVIPSGTRILFAFYVINNHSSLST